MQLKATDSVIVSNVQPEPLEQGQKFEVEDGQGEQLVERGLAEKVKEKAPVQNGEPQKQAPAPANKKAAEPGNKAVPAPVSK